RAAGAHDGEEERAGVVLGQGGATGRHDGVGEPVGAAVELCRQCHHFTPAAAPGPAAGAGRTPAGRRRSTITAANMPVTVRVTARKTTGTGTTHPGIRATRALAITASAKTAI